MANSSVLPKKGSKLRSADLGSIAAPRKVAAAEPRAIVAKIKPLTLSQRARLAWQDLSVTDRETWNAHARSLRHWDPRRRKVVTPSPQSVFVKWMTLAWRLDPGLSAMKQPSAAPYAGEPTAIFVSNATAERQRGAISLCSAVPLPPDIVIEVIGHRISAGDEPIRTARTKKLGYHAFADAEKPVIIPAKKGAYGISYRFVKSSTLQVSPWFEAGIGLVGVRMPAPSNATNGATIVSANSDNTALEPSLLRERLSDPITPYLAVVNAIPERELGPRSA